MKQRQKLLGISAVMIPVLALCVFLLLAPKQAQASGDCPDGTVYAPCYNNGCQSGTGTCWSNGGGGIFVFCSDSDGYANGSGTCSDGCVTCTYGEYGG
ncbi:MAG: hypothetical protein ACRD2H_14700 [Terriglobales bacterium]